MSIFQAGTINLSALIVPGLFIQIVPPQNVIINGVPTNMLGAVGTASWGPVNSPQLVYDYRSESALFGPLVNRKYDLGTACNAAFSQGANNVRAVRVTDGTDTMATILIQSTGLTVNSKWTGSYGNNTQITIQAGSAANTNAVLVALPGYPTERFDNIAGAGTNAFWVNAAAAINNGNAFRGPSAIITALAGALATTPTLTTYTLSGGTDGATTITASVLVGVDGTSRKGMYALRGTGCSIGVLADADDSTQWTFQVAYGLSEGTYMIGTGPSGDTVTNAATAKATAGIDSYAFKLMFGDWIYTYDQVNAVYRYVAPSGFMAGMLANLSPNQSSLNKQMNSIVGTQRSATAQAYSNAELQVLAQAGIDVIANPSAGGNYFSAQIGHNTSSNAAIHGDNYTRMTNYIASTLNAGMGIYVGQPNTTILRARVKATLDSFFLNLLQQGLLSLTSTGAQPFINQCDSNNNTANSIALGQLLAYCKVQYQAIAEEFIISVEGGQTVQIVRSSTQPALQS